MQTVSLHIFAGCPHRVKAGWNKLIHRRWAEWRIDTHKPLDPLSIISLAAFGGPSWLFCSADDAAAFYHAKQNKIGRNNLWLVFLLLSKANFFETVLLNHVRTKHWGPLWVTWPAKSQSSLMPLTLLQDDHLDRMVKKIDLKHIEFWIATKTRD